MLDGEVWRIVPSVPSLMVSSDGRVMVLPHQGRLPNGGVRWYGGAAHFGVWNKTDARFTITIKGQTYKVHQLVCEAFSGPRPFPKAVVMHGDENSANNRASNLLWGTQKENLNAPGFIAYCEARTGEDNPWVKGRRKREAALS